MIATVICAAEGCDNTVVRPRRPGRPAIYCSTACRPSYVPAPVAVEVDQQSISDDEQPGRDWVVRLRRGDRVVVVGRELGRFTALAMAAELHTLLEGTQGGDAS